ncbi:purine and uridine phosphorylase [Ophiobolus disseminans]|uniref:Purine and uridine phosphorylase n=1 Tax=Ophiobolus disseminans TaxID=1469910 RepID=A0A6A6ZBX3_9PLEO|nr:purine and uridine phosphorylase [Ophiobolus disseminans]
MFDPKIYTIGWICAILPELVAARAFLDEKHEAPDNLPVHDNNDYTLGRIGKHNVVIAGLPNGKYGTTSAANVAKDMLRSFPQVRLGLMVGIGGGAPSDKDDIRLGDVVVSSPGNGSGGVFQYDFGKTMQDQDFQPTSSLNQPLTVLLTAVGGLRAQYKLDGHGIDKTIVDILKKNPRLRKEFTRPDVGTDRLYRPSIVHPLNDASCSTACSDDPSQMIQRNLREEWDDNPAIHYGIIASGNQLMKDALVRDIIVKERGIMCFEMEAAGLMDNFPCLVVRGICDYSDSHKNKKWQGYAAMTAAAYAKDLLGRVLPNKVEAERPIIQALQEIRDINESHRNDFKEYLKIVKDNVNRELSDKEKKCLQLFRRAKGEKDATYEWFKDRIEERVQGTCNWLTDHENFKQWLKQDSGPLLVSADPGCGKSVLAKYLIDSFLPGQALPRTVTICYFFFKEQDQNTVRQALCALLHQLFSQKPNLIHHAIKEYENNGESLINAAQSLWTILRLVMQDPETGPVITILDALDECAEFDDLMRNLEAHFRTNQLSCGYWKCLLTSRPYRQIVSKFQGLLADFPRIHIPGEESSETISHEIHRVIEYKVNQLAEKKELSDQVKNHIADQFLKIPHRTYLWVYLVFDNLESEDFKQTLKGVDSTISTLPRSINEAYNRILSKSKEDKIVRKALSIILAAERPLTISEMNVAMNIESTSRSIDDLDLEEEPRFRSRLRSLCGLFVSIYHDRVYFLHQTAREFLLADLASPSPARTELNWHQCITIRDAQHIMAVICVRFLDFFSSDTAPLTGVTSEASCLTNIPTFLNYSAAFWGFHFREAHVNIDEATAVRLALGISKVKSKVYSVWSEIFKKSDWRLENIFFSTRLTLASYFGHSAIVQSLLEKNVNVNEQGGYYGNALQAASSEGHEQVVKLLLEKNADVNTRGGKYGNALYAARHHLEATSRW